MSALAPCPSCLSSTLAPLPAIAPDALSCAACCGFWLSASARQLLSPKQASTPPPSKPPGVCPTCAAALRWQAHVAPTTAWLAVCDAHGAWFERVALPAISDQAWRVAILRAAIEQCRAFRPEQRSALLTAVGALSRAPTPDTMAHSVVHPVGAPMLLTIGVGAMADDGVFLIAQDGRSLTIESPASRWAMSIIVAVVLGFMMVAVVPLLWVTSGAEIALFGFASMCFMIVFGAGMFAVQGLTAKRQRVVFSVLRQTIEILRNGRSEFSIPFALATCTRVQRQTTQGYGDNFNVLIPLGVAELWVHQLSVRNEAFDAASRLAQLLGVPIDLEEEHKH